MDLSMSFAPLSKQIKHNKINGPFRVPSSLDYNYFNLDYLLYEEIMIIQENLTWKGHRCFQKSARSKQSSTSIKRAFYSKAVGAWQRR